MACRVFLLGLAVAATSTAEGEGDCQATEADGTALLQLSPQHAPAGIPCSGSFKVQQGAYCFSYKQACPDMKSLCCEREGETCTPEKTLLLAGDTCEVSTGASCGGPGPSPPPPPPPSISCSKAFAVPAEATCDEIKSQCSGLKALCCERAGLACAGKSSSPIEGDVCKVSTTGQCEAFVGMGEWIKSWAPAPLVSTPSIAVCFSGQVDISAAVAQCAARVLPGSSKWLSVGGGNCDATYNGADVSWNTQKLQQLIDYVEGQGQALTSKYIGIMLDLEANAGGCRIGGTDCGANHPDQYGTSPPASMFETAYKAIKAAGLQVAVSWSYQMPYCMDNAQDIVFSALGSSNVDIVSPQMYGQGSFSSNEYSKRAFNGWGNVSYADYGDTKAAIVPSLQLANHQNDLAANTKNIELQHAQMLAWATKMGYPTFQASPGSLAYQDNR